MWYFVNFNVALWFPSRHAAFFLILPSSQWSEETTRVRWFSVVSLYPPPQKKRFARDEIKSAHLRKLRPKVVQLALTTYPSVFVRSVVFSYKRAPIKSIPQKYFWTIPEGEMLLNNESSGCSKPPP